MDLSDQKENNNKTLFQKKLFILLLNVWVLQLFD